MNKFYAFLNALLLLLTIVVIAAIFPPPPAKPTPAATEEKRGKKLPAVRSTKPAAPQLAEKPANLDALWARSLFRPDRSEPDSADGSGGGTTTLSDLELIGVAMIGDEKVAVLAEMTVPAPPAPASTTPPAAGKETAPPVKPKRVYHLGQPVVAGYTLTAINAEDVELTKGADVQIILMNRGSENSKKRQAAAAAENLTRTAAAVAQPPPAPAPARSPDRAPRQ